MKISGLDQLDQLVMDLDHDIEMLIGMASDTRFQELVSEDIADNFSDVWGSRGGSIDSDWNGHDLVETGNLRDSLTNANRLVVSVIGDSIVFSSSIDYASYVNDEYPFMEISGATVDQINRSISSYLVYYGKLSWVA